MSNEHLYGVTFNNENNETVKFSEESEVKCNNLAKCNVANRFQEKSLTSGWTKSECLCHTMANKRMKNKWENIILKQNDY